MKFSRFLRSSVLAVGLAGCAQQQPEEPKGEAPAVALAPQIADAVGGEAKPQPAPKAEPPAPPPPTFPFPADQGGKALARVVTPDVARPLPAERFKAAPKPRAVPAKVLEPDATAPAHYALPPVLPPKPAPSKPASPAEKVPLELGARADGPPAKPVLPVAAVVTERARDVNLPPAAPVLGRPLNDRVSLDDPTGDLGNAVVVSGAAKVTAPTNGFVKVSVPDPFELGEQVRPKVPVTAEPVAAPVTVNPQRVK